MPVGIVETALVLAAAKKTSATLKKRRRRGQRRQFFAAQRIVTDETNIVEITSLPPIAVAGSSEDSSL